MPLVHFVFVTIFLNKKCYFDGASDRKSMLKITKFI
jgi:hypothetical protein